MEGLSVLGKSCAISLILLSITLGAVAEPDPATIEYLRPGKRPDVPVFAPDQFLNPDKKAPEQVHVSLAGPGAMRVSWVTKDEDVPSKVEFGTISGKYDSMAEGNSTFYDYMMYNSGTIHHVVVGKDKPLKDDTVYYYRCGGNGEEFSFKTPPKAGPDVPIKFAVVGDLGQTEWSVTTLEHIAASGYDVLLLAGDLSYADRYQPRWDTWGRLTEPLASSRPWMVTEGNHESEKLWPFEPPFKAYNARYRMPFAESGSPSNLFYSFEVGPAHILMLGSYTDFDADSAQYKWLQGDLSRVDRSRTPWLIAVLHAPWYNSNEAHQEEGAAMMEAMEALLVQHRVDLLFAGHVHAYERTKRVNGGVADDCGPMHVTIGDGGNREGLATRYVEPQPNWSVKREASFGHGTLELVNNTHAIWQWHRNMDDTNVVADETWVLSHASPSDTCKLKKVGDEDVSLRMKMMLGAK